MVLKLGDYQASQAAYEQATTLDPNCTAAWNGLGILALNRWLEQNRQSSVDRQEAIKAFRNSSAIRSRSTQTHPHDVAV